MSNILAAIGVTCWFIITSNLPGHLGWRDVDEFMRVVGSLVLYGGALLWIANRPSNKG